MDLTIIDLDSTSAYAFHVFYIWYANVLQAPFDRFFGKNVCQRKMEAAWEKIAGLKFQLGSYQLPSTQLPFLCKWSQRGKKYVGRVFG